MWLWKPGILAGRVFAGEGGKKRECEREGERVGDGGWKVGTLAFDLGDLSATIEVF
jgi:hypothetical protein